MKITSCRFERSAFRAEDEPADRALSVVFLGRSNVGKSSLINRLLGTKGLARTSSTPGRTQSINFYRVNESWNIVDLPGYGFAKVPVAVRRAWGPMVEGFLERWRETVALAVLVIDARRPPAELDEVMRDWLAAREIPFVAVATKSDKLSGNGRAKARRSMEEALGASAPTLLVSAQTGLGTREVWKHIDEALAGKTRLR